MRDAFLWSTHSFKLQNFWMRPTVRRKIEKMLTMLLTILLITSFFLYLIFSCLDHNTPLAWWLRFYDACRKDRSPPLTPWRPLLPQEKWTFLQVSFFMNLFSIAQLLFFYTFFCCGLILCIGYLDVGDRFEVHSNNYS